MRGEALLRCRVDVTDRASVSELIGAAVTAFGRLDVLVSNAGIMDRAPFLEMTEEFWHHVIDTNLTGAFLCGQAAARQMIAQGTGGRIVNIASNSGIFGGRGRAAYGASKAGLINLTQTMVDSKICCARLAIPACDSTFVLAARPCSAISAR